MNWHWLLKTLDVIYVAWPYMATAALIVTASYARFMSRELAQKAETLTHLPDRRLYTLEEARAFMRLHKLGMYDATWWLYYPESKPLPVHALDAKTRKQLERQLPF